MAPNTGSRSWRTLTPEEQEDLLHGSGTLADRCRRHNARYKSVSKAVGRRGSGGNPPLAPQPESAATSTSFEQHTDGTAAAEARTSFYLTDEAQRVKTLDQLLDACQVDREAWSVRDYRVNAWEQNSVRGGLITLFQVRANLIPNPDAAAEDALEQLLEQIAAYAPRYEVPPALPGKGSYLLVPCFFDVHLGKRILSKDSLADVAAGFLDAAVQLVARVKAAGYEIDQILFPVGNDLLEADTYQETTTHGTPMPLQARLAEVEEAACWVLVKIVELLATLAPVHVVGISGNHDFHSIWWLVRFLAAWFKNHPRVTVDSGDLPRKYFAWRSILLGLAHGKEEKPPQLPLIMATEAPQPWARSTCREWLIGHKHTQALQVLEVRENRGVLVRLVPSLADHDAWEFLHAYTSNQRAAQGILYHESGAVDTMTIPAGPSGLDESRFVTEAVTRKT
jgi:hypothetical protein